MKRARVMRRQLRGGKSGEIGLQPLRVPQGWKIDWNTFFEVDPTKETCVPLGFFTSSTLIHAINESSRLYVDMAWYPHDHPSGRFCMEVCYCPPYNEKGEPDTRAPVDQSNAQLELLYHFRTRSRAKVVCELERLFRYHRQWTKNRVQTISLEHAAPDASPVNQRPMSPVRTGKFSHINLQPLRVCHTWEIIWNTLYEIDPTEEAIQVGFFEESSLFVAVRKWERLKMDVAWHPQVDTSGQFHMKLFLAPEPPRNSKGKPDKNAPLNFAEAKFVFEFQTHSRAEMVEEMNRIFPRIGWSK
jgi:hypothetical protein